MLIHNPRTRRRCRRTLVLGLVAVLALAATACKPDPLNPEAVNDYVFNRWKANDPAATSPYTTNSVRFYLFATPSAGYQKGRCDGTAGTYYCTYGNRRKHLVLGASNGASPQGHYTVASISFGDNDVHDVLDLFLISWARADQPAQREFATNAVVNHAAGANVAARQDPQIDSWVDGGGGEWVATMHSNGFDMLQAVIKADPAGGWRVTSFEYLT